MPNTIFDRPDLSAFTRLDDLGLEVTAQRIEPDHAVLACRITGQDRWCRRCGCQGISRDTVIRRLAHVPYGWRPTILHVSVRRYRCPECAHVWRQDMSQAADPRAKLSRAAVCWALTGVGRTHALTSQRLGLLQLHDNLLRRVLREVPHGHPFCPATSSRDYSEQPSQNKRSENSRPLHNNESLIPRTSLPAAKTATS